MAVGGKIQPIIAEYLKNKGFSSRDLASKFGSSHMTWNNYLALNSEIGLELLERIIDDFPELREAVCKELSGEKRLKHTTDSKNNINEKAPDTEERIKGLQNRVYWLEQDVKFRDDIIEALRERLKQAGVGDV